MPALDFPSSPTNGQIYGQYTYDSTKGAWRVTANPAATVVSSPTAPSSPVAGNLWLNTNDGVLFVYYNDGDTSQWVEVKSNTASGSTVAARVDAIEAADLSTNRSGLIPFIPASIAVGSGSASVSSTGIVTYTGASSLSLNNIFTTTYSSYKIIVDHVLSADTGLNLRFRVSGTDNIATVYNNHHAYWGTGGNGANIIANSQQFGGLFGHRTQRGIYELVDPQQASRTLATFFGAAESAAASTEQHTSSVIHKSNTQFDGFTLFPTSGTFTGTLQVYGYR